MKPLITTVIPTYRRPERLKKAIQSVIAQTYPHFEVCVYDDASQDSTRLVVEELKASDARIHYYEHAQNRGSNQNFDYAISQVKTPFFSILSDDDFLFPEFFETTLLGFEKNPSAGASIGAIVDWEENGTVIDIALHRWKSQSSFPAPQGLFEMIGKYSNWMGFLFRTEAVRQIGGIDCELEAVDVDFCMRLAARFPLIVSKQVCGVFVHHPSSYSGKIGLKLFWPGWLKTIQTLKSDPCLSQEMKHKIEKALEKDLERLLLSTGRTCLEKKDFKTAEDIVEILKRYPQARLKRFYLKQAIQRSRSSDFAHRLILFLFRSKDQLKKTIQNLAFSNKDQAIVEMQRLDLFLKQR